MTISSLWSNTSSSSNTTTTTNNKNNKRGKRRRNSKQDVRLNADVATVAAATNHIRDIDTFELDDVCEKVSTVTNANAGHLVIRMRDAFQGDHIEKYGDHIVESASTTRTTADTSCSVTIITSSNKLPHKRGVNDCAVPNVSASVSASTSPRRQVKFKSDSVLRSRTAHTLSRSSVETQQRVLERNRPLDTDFAQQRLLAWKPMLTPKFVINLFLACSLVFIPIGVILYHISAQIYELNYDYTDCVDINQQNTTCHDRLTARSTPDAYSNRSHSSVVCTCRRYYQYRPHVLSIFGETIGPANSEPDDLATADLVESDQLSAARQRQTRRDGSATNSISTSVDNLFVYYALDNFYQNSRRYIKSVDNYQLVGLRDNRGDKLDDELSANCEPFRYQRQKPTATVSAKVMPNAEKKTPRSPKLKYAPCGAIANSLFNDTFRLYYVSKRENKSLRINISKHDLGWNTDRAYKYGDTARKNLTFVDTVHPPNWSRNVSELENGYANEDLMVWMRTAAFSSFRKLYGRILLSDNAQMTSAHSGAAAASSAASSSSSSSPPSSWPHGEYYVEIDYRYPVKQFGGRKYFIVTNLNSWMGGKCYILAMCYMVVGFLCLLTAIALFIIHIYFGNMHYNTAVLLVDASSNLIKEMH